MKFHELAWSFMSLYAVPFFVRAAHKNFAVLVYFEKYWIKFLCLKYENQDINLGVMSSKILDKLAGLVDKLLCKDTFPRI